MPVSYDAIANDFFRALRRITDRRVLGVDAGTSSLKIVQLRRGARKPILETYGEIDLGPYAEAPPARVAGLPPQKIAAALLDLAHEVDAGARRGGFALPLSSAWTSLVELPKRDEEQMRRIVPIEAQRYVPIPKERVALDWFAIPAEKRGDAFDRLESRTPVKAAMQKIFLAAVDTDAIRASRETAKAARIAARFSELELFSAARGCPLPAPGPHLIVDIGASFTKIYLLGEHRVAQKARALSQGGEAMTEGIMRALGWDFERAERAKRERGFRESPRLTADENSQIAGVLASIVSTICKEAERVAAEYGGQEKSSPAGVFLIGGGACMPGIAAYAQERMQRPVAAANSFELVQGPFVLEEMLREAGPKFCVALGCALRALRRGQ